MAKATDALNFSPIGRGIEFAQDGGHVYLRLPLDRAAGVPSSTGKTLITSQTVGGWANIPGTELTMNLQAGFRAPKS